MRNRALRNRTVTCTKEEMEHLSVDLLQLSSPIVTEDVLNQIVNQDFYEAVVHLPCHFVDLLILDPPYNLTKNFNGYLFSVKESGAYVSWFEHTLSAMLPLLKSGASVYVCSDWKTSTLVFPVLDKYLHVRNRITWEREKGRGAKANWKNNTEDIWFCTRDDSYTFNIDAVKVKRRVVAPYRHGDGTPKDWDETHNGNYRVTYPSNLWSDITVPFWSMSENTDHPTQKPEKLIAKLVLASTNPTDVVFDPFLGSGTTAVVAKKLQRHFLGVEMNREYCCWALKRLRLAQKNSSIQGYVDGMFWERNTLIDQSKSKVSQSIQQPLPL